MELLPSRAAAHAATTALRRAAGLVAAFALAAPGLATALPMGPYESTMLMLDSTPSSRLLAINHAVAQTWAPGFTLRQWDEPLAHGQQRRHDTAGLSLTHRLQRWNLPHAQANLWLLADAGSARRGASHGQPSGRGGYGALSVMADYETTRLYAGGTLKALRGDEGLRHDQARLRAGFAFREADYEEIQPWFVIEAERTRYGTAAMREGTRLTPMLRFIHRRWFVEIGANRDGGMFNLMFNH